MRRIFSWFKKSKQVFPKSRTLVGYILQKGEYLLVVFLRGLSIPIRYGINFLSARFYGAAVVGYFAVTRTFLDLLITLSSFGGDKMILKLLAPVAAQKKKRKLQVYFTFLSVIYIILGVALAVILYFSSPLLAKIYGDPQYVVYFRLTAFIFPFMLFLILQHQTFRAIGRSILATLFETTFFNLTTLVLVVVVYLVSFRYLYLKQIGLHVAFLISSMFVAILAFLIQLSKNGFNLSLDISNVFKRFFSDIGVRKFFYTAARLTMLNILIILNARLDKLILPLYESASQIGVYDISGKLALLLLVPLMAVLTVTPKHIARLYKASKFSELKRYMFKLSGFIAMLDLPLYLAIMFFAQILLGFFGHEFVVGVSALKILATAEYINAATGPVGQALILIDREKDYLKISIIALLGSLAITWWLISQWGIVGAALGYGLNVIFVNVGNFIVLHRHLS